MENINHYKGTMPKVSTIQDVLEAVDDAPIYAFKGLLKSFTKFYPASPDKPDSQSFQLATLCENGKEITAKLRNRPELPVVWKGKPIYILAKHTDKGWFGSKAADNKRVKKDSDGNPILDAQGNKVQSIERVLWVTASAEIVLAADYEKTAQDAPQQAANQGNVPTPSIPSKPPISQSGGHANEYLPGEDEENGDSATPEADRASKAVTQEEAIKEARRLSAQTRNAFRIALRTAEQVRADYYEDYGLNLSAEQFRVITSSIFLRFKDTGVLSCLPDKPMDFKPLKPPTSQQESNGDQPQ